MKSIPSGLAAHYAGGVTTLARLWLVTRRDGAVYAFTDHDAAITYGGHDYAPSSAFDASALVERGDASVANLDVQGILDSAGITAADIEAGLWDGAAVELRQVNWSNLSDGAELLRIGTTGTVQRQGSAYTTELRGLLQALQGNVGRIVTPACDAALGDARCGVDLGPLTVTGILTTVTSRRQLADSALADPDGYFAGGQITLTSGAAAGATMDIKTHSASGGVLVLQLPLPALPAPGDAYTMVPGCDKTKITCIAKFSNVLNFRGFSFLPGADALARTTSTP